MWATALGRSDGLTRPGLAAVFGVALLVSMAGLAAVFGVALLVSMAGLAYAMRTLPVGTAYAVWVGIGAVLTATYAMWTGTEQVSALRVLLLLLLLLASSAAAQDSRS